MDKTYKEQYIAGKIEFEAIDDYSYQWGLNEEAGTLREYLGLSTAEEDAWISVGEEALKEMLDAEKEKAIRG